MKKSFQISYALVLATSLAFSQNQKINNDSIKYFDENYNQVSKTEYETIKRTNRLLSIQGDSINHKTLSSPINTGTVKNRRYLDSLLSLSTKRNIDSTKPLVLIYYPKKDTAYNLKSKTEMERRRKDMRSWYNKRERKINKVKESNIIYVYKESDGLFGKNDGYKEWIKDPEQIIERRFFKPNHPYCSFIIISIKGQFISYFGESPKESVWKAVEVLQNQ